MKVLGYYADIIPTKVVNSNDIKEFTIQDVVVNAQAGFIKVKIANSLSEDSYFRRTGMKMALSITTGNTDMTSQFVDVAPVDQSGDVYVETLKLSSGSVRNFFSSSSKDINHPFQGLFFSKYTFFTSLMQA